MHDILNLIVDQPPKTINELLKLISEVKVHLMHNKSLSELSLIEGLLFQIKESPELQSNCKLDIKLDNSDVYMEKIIKIIAEDNNRLSQNNISSSLVDLKQTPVNHETGLKHVFRSNLELDNKLTQIAYGVFEPGESSGSHIHNTMDEYFFFMKGFGQYIVDGNIIDIIPNTFIEILAGKTHNLIAIGELNLEFVYWGVAK
jgi:mannose-6-phosphate isomerase-like protein (cupin superfamily)